MVWTPPTPPPNTRADNTPLPTNHIGDHNDISDALTAIINVLGSNPEGAEASITALVDVIDPADAIIAVGGSTAPSGWHLCNGDAVSRSTYAATFARIGTTFGVGDGSTTFNVPDLRSRFVAGKGLAAWSDALAETGGSADAVAVAHTHAHTHGIDHNHASATTNTDTHTHLSQGLGYLYRDTDYSNNQSVVTPVDDGGPYAVNFHVDTEADTHSHTLDLPNHVGDSTQPEGVSQTPTADGTDANLPPYQTLNYCIRLR